MAPSDRPAELRDYLQLFRAGNVFTAFADILMGYLFVQRDFSHAARLAGLLAASGLLYTAGMVLNDVWDIETDRRQRPDRPLPAGKIPLARARRLGIGLLGAGIATALLAGLVPPVAASWWRAGLIASLLAVTILMYDGPLKSTPLGPLAMGACRGWNVLLGMSLVPISAPGSWWGFGPSQLLAAAGIGVYIVGVTVFARCEASTSSRPQLALGVLLMLAGFALLSMIYGYLPGDFRPFLSDATVWWLLLGLVAFTIVRRCLLALTDPQPWQVQLAVTHSVLSLIVLDAAVALLVGRQPAYAAVVIALLVPTLLVSRWLYVT